MFHLSSALVLIGMTYWILALQARLRFQQRIWQALHSSQRQLLIDWPERFFMRLSQAWNLSLEGEALTVDPLRIDLQAWVRCHAALGVRSIVRGPGSHIRVCVTHPDPAGFWQEQLRLAMNTRITVEVSAQ